MKAQPLYFLTPTTALAAIGASAVGVAQSVFYATSEQRLAVIAVGVGVAVVSSVGLWWAERKAPRFIPWLVGVSLVLAGIGVWVSGGAAYVMMMPGLSCAVLYLATRTAFTVASLAVVEFGLVAAHRAETMLKACATTLGLASAVLFVCVFSLFAKRERLARREVERLSAEVDELATARERNRIARELHDSLGHVLTVANVQLEAARATSEGREERLVRVQELLKGGLHDLRRTVTFWRDTAMTEARFAAALAELISHTQATGLRVDLKTEGSPRVLAPDVGFALYRGAQEALTNVHRHARATTVTMRLGYEPASVSLRIIDDGVGRPELQLGNGLRGLQDRLGALAGSLHIEAAEPRGVCLELRVPA